ncbi:transcriptional regulator [Bifidobacterium animalis subsp. animalis]|nr:transcriptional regulator [Bifidobacterium animalis subsp. animalis]
MLTIGETASLCAVSVRMLRHWESVGLLRPERDGNGYRLYDERDIARIRRIQLYRDLGLNSEQIGAVLGQPTKETLALLRTHRDRIEQRIAELQETLHGIDALSGHARHDTASTQSTDKENDMYDPTTDEAHERWGDSAQWMEYAEYRTRTDDAQQQADLDAMQAVERELAQAMRRGVEPGSDEANELALRHRESLTWYHVTPSMHVCLATMYTADPRFRAHYDAIEPGLADWLRAIIEAQAATEGVDVEHARWE